MRTTSTSSTGSTLCGSAERHTLHASRRVSLSVCSTYTLVVVVPDLMIVTTRSSSTTSRERDEEEKRVFWETRNIGETLRQSPHERCTTRTIHVDRNCLSRSSVGGREGGGEGKEEVRRREDHVRWLGVAHAAPQTLSPDAVL